MGSRRLISAPFFSIRRLHSRRLPERAASHSCSDSLSFAAQASNSNQQMSVRASSIGRDWQWMVCTLLYKQAQLQKLRTHLHLLCCPAGARTQRFAWNPCVLTGALRCTKVQVALVVDRRIRSWHALSCAKPENCVEGLLRSHTHTTERGGTANQTRPTRHIHTRTHTHTHTSGESRMPRLSQP
jgi:hypothetical protein